MDSLHELKTALIEEEDDELIPVIKTFMYASSGDFESKVYLFYALTGGYDMIIMRKIGRRRASELEVIHTNQLSHSFRNQGTMIKLPRKYLDKCKAILNIDTLKHDVLQYLVKTEDHDISTDYIALKERYYNLIEDGLFKDALLIIRQILKLQPDRIMHIHMIRILLELNQKDEAIERILTIYKDFKLDTPVDVGCFRWVLTEIKILILQYMLNDERVTTAHQYLEKQIDEKSKELYQTQHHSLFPSSSSSSSSSLSMS